MRVKDKLLGLVICLLVTILAFYIVKLPFQPFTIHQGARIIHPVEPLIVAIILGMVVASVIFKASSQQVESSNINGVLRSAALSKQAAPGITIAIKLILPLAIVLMGAQFDFKALVSISGHALWVNLTCIILAYFLTQWICRSLALDKKMSLLVTIGTAICGGTAIVAASQVLKSSSQQTAIALAVVSLYGLIAIFLFPFLGHTLAMSDFSYGVWSGAVIQAMPQVVAAGFAYSISSGKVATVVKMVRILLLGPMVVLLAVQYHSQQGQVAGKWYRYFPRFIMLFLFMVLINTLGYIHYLELQWQIPLQAWIVQCSTFCITVAMAGVGLNTDLLQLLRSGIKPMIAGGIAMIVLGVIGFFLAFYFV